MKIIAVDNYDRETVSDFLVCENINASKGKLVVDFLNRHYGEPSDYYYRLVPDEYKLYKYEP